MSQRYLYELVLCLYCGVQSKQVVEMQKKEEQEEKSENPEEIIKYLDSFYDSLIKALLQVLPKTTEILSSKDKKIKTAQQDGIKSSKRRRVAKASYWEMKKAPYLIKNNLLLLVLVCFVLILVVVGLIYDYILNSHQLLVDGIVLLALLLAIIAVSFVTCYRSFNPGKQKKITVFFEIPNSSSSDSKNWYVIVLSIKIIPNVENYVAGKQNTEGQKRVGVVLDNFTAKKIGSDGLKNAGELLVKLRDAINSASKALKKNDGYAVIQYHVKSKYLNYVYFRLIKDNLHVSPEPENPKLYKKFDKCEKFHSFLYTVNIQTSNNNC